MPVNLTALRQQSIAWLRRRTESPRRALKQFTTGGFIFCGGMMVIVLSDRLLPASLSQESLALIGLALVVAGGLYALGGYLALSLFRVLLYLLEPARDSS